jgi:hypothetical protein
VDEPAPVGEIERVGHRAPIPPMSRKAPRRSLRRSPLPQSKPLSGAIAVGLAKKPVPRW